MSILTILKYPDQRLRQKAKEIPSTAKQLNQIIDRPLKKLIDDMLETMYESKGIGLAATQINQHIRLFVMDISQDRNSPTYFINPTIKSRYDKITCQEGCLSVPSFQAPVERARKIDLSWEDLEKKQYYETFEDLKAVCAQHEIDHLNGKLFVDHLNEKDKALFLSELNE